MNELVGAWIHGFANGHYGGSHDFWLVFREGGLGDFIHCGWYLYRHDSFRWVACPEGKTFRILRPESQFLISSEMSPTSIREGWYSYALRTLEGDDVPSLIVTLPGVMDDAAFIYRGRDPLQLAGITSPDEGGPLFPLG